MWFSKFANEILIHSFVIHLELFYFIMFFDSPLSSDDISSYITEHLKISLQLFKLYTFDITILFLYLFAIFILQSRESELYRYTLDGKSALAWELPFSRFMGHLSST